MKEQIKKINKKKVTRRDFIKTATVAGLSFTIVPRHVLGGARYVAPSEKMNIAGVGVGGMGKPNLMAMAKIGMDADSNPIPVTGPSEGENIVALCDVDDKCAAETYKLFPNAKRYRDFREMLEKQKDIDGVMIATPDHTHATIAMMAINMGKHVYVQKPLTYTVKEARMLTEAARKAGVVTQMGNQGHSREGSRLICEWIWDGAIGDVTEVDMWTDRPIWPQGMDRPAGTPPVPKSLDWDLWIGPAPMRPYHPGYHPFNWRGYWDFGTGSLGDMACHIMDPAFWALKLKYPTSFEASVSHYLRSSPENPWGDVVYDSDTYPRASKVHYQFPSREGMPPVKLTWYDGGLLPRRPEGIEEGRQLGGGGNGVIFHGTKGMIMCGAYGASPRLIPETAMKAYKRPPKTIERIKGSHEQNWIEACKGGKVACSNFDYSGPLTETVLAGNLAMRFPGTKLKWDGENMKVTNHDEANEFVHRQYRKGWTL
jgi:predicted dehydrogenase